jgi:cytochrome c553
MISKNEKGRQPRPVAPARRPGAALVRRAGVALALFVITAAQAQDTSRQDHPTVQRAVQVCASCHGEGGRSTDARYPSLAGQVRDYTVRQLKDFRAQQRSETGPRAYMWGISALLTDEAIEGLADYYAEQAPARGKAASPKLAVLGRRLFEQGVPARGVRPCAQCHGAQAEGASVFPRLAGQQAAYIERQLSAFGTPLRPHGVIMRDEVKAMTPGQIRAVAAYLHSL